jgi:hypothetical protein
MIEKRQFDIAKAGVSKQAIVAMIVAGAGHAGDEAMEKSFANLSLGERASLFKSVFRLTAPGGIGPFVELVLAATQGQAEPATEAAPKKKKSGRQGPVAALVDAADFLIGGAIRAPRCSP